MLITDAYRSEQQALHARGNYGTASLQFGEFVSALIDKTGARTLLDYGCGSMQNLSKVIEAGHDVEYEGYDPAVPHFSQSPDPADLVCCIDVLEHIEPECLDEVLEDLQRVTQSVGFFTVHTGPAVKVLSDGRNAHLIQQPAEWWFNRLSPLFQILTFQRLPNGASFVVRKR
jgi:hypothetical protein